MDAGLWSEVAGGGVHDGDRAALLDWPDLEVLFSFS